MTESTDATAEKKTKLKPQKAKPQKSTGTLTTSTSVVSSNIIVAKSFTDQRDDEVKVLAIKAAKIAKSFEDITNKIAAFETEVLYKYIGQTYDLYEQIKLERYAEYFFTKLRLVLKDNGIKTTKDTTDLSCLIRLVFKCKPKTAHLYVRGIEAAQKADVKPAAFVKFVNDEGGLEKLRISQVQRENAQTQADVMKKATALVWRYLWAREGKPLAITNVTRKQLNPTENNFVILVGAAYQDGTVNILSGLPGTKNVEEFIINSIAQNFCTNLIEAEKYVVGLESGELVEKLTNANPR